jgi:carboxymethylenebutenolidase
MGVIPRLAALLVAVAVSWPSSPARADVREGIEHYRSGEATVALEWFAPAAPGRFPAVLLLHGSGGLDPGTAIVFRAAARDFAERGYAAMIPHYFDRTGHSAGEPLKPEELRSFVGAVADGIDFGVESGIVDPERIGIMGYSMGAYIAFFRGVRDPRIKAIVSVAGSLPVESRSKFPPVLILQGSNDRSNPVSRVRAFQEALKAKETPSASHVYKGMGHNFDVDRWEDATFRAAAFLDRYLKAPRKGKPKKPTPARKAPARDELAKTEADEPKVDPFADFSPAPDGEDKPAGKPKGVE